MVLMVHYFMLIVKYCLQGFALCQRSMTPFLWLPTDNGHNNVESNKPMQDDLFYNDLRNDKEQYEIVSDSTYGERRNSNSDLQFPPLELSTNGPSMINEQSYSDYQSAEQMHDVGRKTYSYMHYDSPRNLPIFKHPMQVQSSFPVIHTVLSKENNDMGQKDLLEKQGAGSLSQTAEGGSIDSFVVHKSSHMPSVDDISSAINSFKQLQNAIGQLNYGTRKCLRNRFYRLSRNARKTPFTRDTRKQMKASLEAEQIK